MILSLVALLLIDSLAAVPLEGVLLTGTIARPGDERDDSQRYPASQVGEKRKNRGNATRYPCPYRCDTSVTPLPYRDLEIASLLTYAFASAQPMPLEE